MKKLVLVLIAASMAVTACSSDGKTKVLTIANVGGNPDGVTVADSGNIYITDIGNGDVKQVEEDGTVTVIANLDDELGKDTHPDGITAVTVGTTDILYVTDTGIATDGTSTDGSITKIEVQSDGTVTTTKDFINTSVLDNPTGIAADNNGNLYVADQQKNDVYRITMTGGVPGTPESLTDSLGAGVEINDPHGLTLVTNDDGSITLYTTDQGNSDNNVVQIDIPASGVISEIEVTELTPDNTGGTDTGDITNAKFNEPHGISTDKNGAIFVCDENNNRVQIITPSGNVITLAGDGTAGDTDGDADVAQFSQPRGLATDSNGDLLVCDYGNGKVKKIKM